MYLLLFQGVGDVSRPPTQASASRHLVDFIEFISSLLGVASRFYRLAAEIPGVTLLFSYL